MFTNGPPCGTQVRAKWQKCPNSALCSKEKVVWCTQLLNLQSWRSSVHPEACFSFTKENLKLAASVEQRRNREDPQNKWFWQLLGMFPKIPLLRPVSYQQLAHHNHQIHNRHGLLPVLRKPPVNQMSWEHQSLTLDAKKAVTKRPAACCLEANKEAKLVERKAWLILEASNLGRRMSHLKAEFPHWQSVGKNTYRTFIGGGAVLHATSRNGIVSSDSPLETGHVVVWSASCWLFKIVSL